ncbi:hypothetical protein FIBSPDRAFT_942243 [Athelia psychrophila]|uniref:Uncharacterized protein n=1 Tax=Athelia psychrophila TaxID=1759441 RepID=A0A167SL82_9AGAM|nr:hypothetical protein FIBSPDRAFT_942243 [Fibularhizoctonia sp. CBS 109695]
MMFREPTSTLTNDPQNALILPAAFTDFIIASHPTSVPGPGDGLVRKEAVALNPIDRYLQKTPFGEQCLTFPAVIGTDRPCGQEYTVAAAKYASKLPTNVSFDEAASIPLVMISAAVGFY